ncbi:MAG: hypothetical protein K6F95_08810 [Selenomonas sp.]|uniref:acyltransferase family protein n=1 Tax=Selenomonas sp. TaxID=2053611 RepID=UPI0025E57E0A|nr:hypothetical protein [Selenomonas sp.]MCR5757991.1 hypothetical protein [Selenomonas sp.]
MLIEFRDKRRLPAVDIFRGMVIAIMLIVNALPDFDQANPWLVHAPWTGMTIADLAFPGFVFIMGVAGALWFPKHERDDFGEKFGLILRRSLLLILIGFFMGQFPLLLDHLFHPSAESLLADIAQHGRVMGVLQRLGLVYFFGMLLTWWLRSEKLVGIMAFMLLAVSSLCFHLYDTTNSFSPDNNISMLMDGLFPGTAHCYMGRNFDPEGLYGTIAATASFLWGMLAGRCLTMKNAPAFERVLSMFILGTVLLLAGGVWSYTDVISKQLWTAPYVLFTSGGFMWALGLLEMSNTFFPDFTYGFFTPFRIWGLNPLFLFIVPDMVLMVLWQLQIRGAAFYPWLWEMTLKGAMNVQFSIFLFALLWAMLWLPVANFLYKRRIILKL